MRSIDPKTFEPVFRQKWENARHIKSDHIWSVNIFSVISAGATREQNLAVMHGIEA